MTTVPKKSKLSRLSEQLFIQARRRGGTHRVPLPGGARLAITVHGLQVIVSFAREGRRLGDTELITFFHHCGVPERARRVPEVGQTVRRASRVVEDEEHGRVEIDVQWYVVGWIWEESEGEVWTD